MYELVWMRLTSIGVAKWQWLCILKIEIMRLRRKIYKLKDREYALSLDLSYDNIKTNIILVFDNIKIISFSLYQLLGRERLLLRDPGLKMSWS